MAILKRALIVLGVLLLIPVIAVAGLFLYARTDSGLATIASLASTYGSSDDTKIAIGKIEGSFPSDLTIRDLALGDRKGVWLTIDRARVAWTPSDLFGRKLTVDAIELGRVDVARTPLIMATTEPEAPADPNAPLIPDLPIELDLRRFTLDDLTLREPLLGVPARLAADASATLRSPAQGLSAQFDVRRTDGVAGQVKALATYVPATRQIKISVRGDEPAGGLIARLAQIPDLPPVGIGIEGGGTLDALRAQAMITAGDRGRINAAVDLGRAGTERTIKATVEGDVGRLVPPAYAALAAGDTRITVDAVAPDSGPIRLVDAAVSAPAAQLGVRGTVDPDAKTLDVAYALKAGDAARFASVLPAGMGWGALSLDGTAKGPFTHPVVSATLNSANLNTLQGGAQTARIVLDVIPNGPLMEEGARVAAKADVTAEGVKFANDGLMSGVGRTLKFTTDLTTNLKGEADVRNAELALANARVSYAGQVSLEAAKGRATATASDLSTFSTLAGRTLGGALDLAADVDLAFDLSRLGVALNGSAKNLVTSVAQADALTGGEVAVTGGVSRATDGAFAFDGVRLKGGHFVVTADGSATLQRADVRLRSEIDDLRYVDSRASGKATVDATLTGALDDLGVKANLQVPDGVALDHALKNVRLDVDAVDVTGAIGGVIELGGSLDGKPLRGSGRLVTESNGVRRIEGLDLAIASAAVKGDVSATPAGLATGKLSVSAPDLSEVGALALTELAGRFSGDVGLAVVDGVQHVRIDASGSDIVAPGASVGKVDVAATIVDPAGKITLDGTANAAGVAASGQMIEKLSVNARGAPDGMDVSADMTALGSALATTARVAYAPAETRIDLSRLQIRGGGKSADLAGPARVRIANNSFLIDSLALRANDGGVLSVTGVAGQKLDLTLDVRDLPLALAAAFNPTLGPQGLLSADAKVTGSAVAPIATFNASIRDLSVAQLRAANVGALQVATRGSLQDARVATDTTITGPKGLRIVSQGSAPLGEGDLDMTVSVRDAPLALADGFAPGLGLSGLLTADAKIGGPVAAPRGTYSAKVVDFTSAKARGVPPVAVTTSGTLEGLRVTTDTLVTGGGGIRATAKGSAPLGAGDIDMDVVIAELPLSLANAFDPALGLAGRMQGGAKLFGPVSAPRGGYDLRVTGLTATQGRGLPPLDVSTKGAFEGGRVTTDTLVRGADFTVTAKGAAPIGEGDLAMDVGIRNLPLALANGFQPGLGLAGVLNGDARVEGPVATPRGTYKAKIENFTSTHAVGAPAIAVDTSGSFDSDRVTTDTQITGGGGVRASARGSAPIGQGDLDMDVAIAELPLSLVNAVMPTLGLGGTLQGGAKVSGPISGPRGTYDLKIVGLTAAQAKGVPPLEVITKGELQGPRVTTDTLITGVGVRATAKGSAPLGDGDLDMDVAIVELPLSLANAVDPALGLTGALQGGAKISGPVRAPRGGYDFKITGLTSAMAKGAPALLVTTKGELEGERVTTDTVVSGGGFAVTAKGAAPIGQGDLAMDVGLRNVPLSLANGFAPGVGLAGVLNGAARIEGAINAPRGTYQAKVENFTSDKARGVQPVTIETRGDLHGDRITTDTLITGGGGIRATAKGSAPLGNGDIDMDVAVASLPMSLANAVSPTLGLAGNLQGGAKVEGPLTAPRGGYDFKITGLTSAQAKGVPALTVTTKGELEGQRITTDTLVTGGGGLRLSAKGAAPIGAGDLDMTIELRSVPLALANGFSPGLGANGTLQGDARVTGSLSAPRGNYSLKVSNLSTAQTRGAGVPAAQIDAKGALEGSRVTTDTVVTGAGGLRVTANGSAPLGQGNLDLRVAGRAPLAFLNDTLSVSGDRVDGAATFDVKVGGSTASPSVNGTAALVNASYSNRASGVQLRGIQASVAANGTNIDIRSLRATTRNGGTISGSGRVAVDPARGFPGEINIRAQNAEVLGTDIVTAIIDSNLTLQGALARRPTIGGTVSARSVEIQIPDRLPAQYTPLTGVKHRGATAQVTRQLNLVNPGGKTGGKPEDGFLATLDIDVQANNRIFIRGMGMTAEAGGQIKLVGTSANPQPTGAFELRSGRGQIVVIGQRLTFTRGSVSFAGDLDPTIDFLAETKARDITAQVVVTGTASRPQINFTSQPALPTDEVLARLLFKKSAGELNASEALQLAQGLAQYTSGGGGSSALESVRKSLGVDVLNVTAGDGAGAGPAVAVGRYISDNIYLGVSQGTTPESSKVTVDIDVTKNVKVQGETSASGNSGAGVAVEWDY